MIEAVKFKNFKVLRDATLPLGPFTLIVGPNGSGKSTALQGLEAFRTSGVGNDALAHHQVASLGVDDRVSLAITYSPIGGTVEVIRFWEKKGQQGRHIATIAPPNKRGQQGRRITTFGPPNPDRLHEDLLNSLSQMRIFSLRAPILAQSVALQPGITLGADGAGLAGVLDQLRDTDPERFEALNHALQLWLPEFDRVLFETPAAGQRAFLLRTRLGRYKIAASELSEGTLLALALLTLAYLPQPPAIVCFEEPDRATHPRLLRRVQDALYRLAYPESVGEDRPPVQVIATTHNPYFLELFRDHPEEVVIASKRGLEASFERLSDRPNIEDMLKGVHLSEIWYSGVLEGVPSGV
jgi:predicted ATPase